MLEDKQDAKDTLIDYFINKEELIKAIKSMDDITNTIHEIADNKVSVYNQDRLEWLAESFDNVWLVEDAVEELGMPEPFDLFTIIGYGQYRYNRALLDEALSEIKTDLGIEDV